MEYYYLIVGVALRFYLFQYQLIYEEVWHPIVVKLHEINIIKPTLFSITLYKFLNCTFCTGGQVGFWIYLIFLMDWSTLDTNKFYSQLPQLVAFGLANALASMIVTKYMEK